MKAYHFTEMDERGRAVRRDDKIIRRGAREVYRGRVEMCESGLHASVHPFDALKYAPGPMLRLVECDEIEERGGDKLVCRVRKEIARVDMARELRLFACDCAARVLPQFEVAHPGDTRPSAAIDVARRFADGQASADELAAASDVALVAARAAAMDAEIKWQRARFARVCNRALKGGAK